MNRSQRISVNPQSLEDKYIKLKLEQDVDNFELMSLKISTKEFYENFNANYGVLVGRVIANEGVGIPNAKISIFIPLQEEDEEDESVISIYPYKTPRDKNSEGKKYNLLPRVSVLNPEDNTFNPKQPFGSFPIKPEIVTNPKFLKVYKKYYKYTATTNDSGDYMIFGIPTGVQTVHMSADITDIGKYSMTPAAMVTNLGYSPNLFTDNNTRIKESSDLDDLPNIETQEISVDIIPFWGDIENFEIGITRQDFRIRAQLSQTITIFGTSFTDGEEINWGGSNFDSDTRGKLYAMMRPVPDNMSFDRKRITRITERIYYYPANISDDEIDSPDFDPINNAIILDPSQYTSFKRDGDFVFILTANRNKIITDEEGNTESVPFNSTEGIFTEFRGFITFEYSDNDLPLRSSWEADDNRNYHQIRYRFKVPQYSNTLGRHLKEPDTTNASDDNNEWRKQNFTFKGGKIYSVSRFISTNEIRSGTPDHNTNTSLLDDEILNNGRYFYDGFGSSTPVRPNNANSNNVVGLLVNTIVSRIPPFVTNDFEFNDDNLEFFKFPSNASVTYNDSDIGVIESFGGNWMNFAIYFPQVARNQTEDDDFSDIHATTNFQRTWKSYHFINDNNQPIAAGIFNTKWYARNDLNWLDFIEVDIADLNKFKAEAADSTEPLPRGFKKNIIDDELLGSYRNGINSPSWGGDACPQGGGKLNGNPSGSADPYTYFYRGWGGADCLQFLQELNII